MKLKGRPSCVLEALSHVRELEVCIGVNSGDLLKVLADCSVDIAAQRTLVERREAGGMAQPRKDLAPEPQSLVCRPIP